MLPITSLLTLEPLTESEQQKLKKFGDNFDSYYKWGKISEGEIKFMTISPLLGLAGFYPCSKIRITLEEKIAQIYIEGGDRIIKGRIDILTVGAKHLRPDLSVNIRVFMHKC
jgi:hypothetical protein